MRQKGVTAAAMRAIRKGCLKEFEKLNITKVQAFVSSKNELGHLETSGRTIRRVFNGEHVRESTIRKLINKLGLEQVITNGKIDIQNEGNKNNTEGATNAETVSKEGQE